MRLRVCDVRGSSFSSHSRHRWTLCDFSSSSLSSLRGELGVSARSVPLHSPWFVTRAYPKQFGEARYSGTRTPCARACASELHTRSRVHDVYRFKRVFVRVGAQGSRHPPGDEQQDSLGTMLRQAQQRRPTTRGALHEGNFEPADRF